METNSFLHETVLADFHVAHGARMVPFAGWNMPVQYADGIKAEHLATAMPPACSTCHTWPRSGCRVTMPMPCSSH